MFNEFIIILAKFGLAIIAVIFILRWFIFIPYLWLKYDKPIIKLKDELDKFKNEQRSKLIALSRMDGSINQKTMIVNEKLDILETRRRLFIDRVNLFLSISSINKS